MEKIIVRNFGPINELNIEIKRFTVFIGTQGSGKSTISKLLTICRDIYWQTNVAQDADVSKFFVDYGISTYFKPSTYIEYSYNDLVITYENGRFSGKKEGCTKEEYRKFQEAMFSATISMITRAMGYEKLEDFKENMDDARLFFANIRTLMYIPSERILAGQFASSLASLVVAQVPLSNPLLEYLSFFEKAQKEFPDYKVPFLNAELQNKDGEKYIKVKADNHEELVPLSVCSSGLQSVFPMFMVIDYCVKNKYFDSFVIEEPELNLYPTNQRELLHFVLQRFNNANEKDSINVILTTHSPYTLSILNVALMASIVAEDADFSEEVNMIVPKNEQLNPNDLAIYALSDDNQLCCKSLLDEKTKLIGMNALDAVSDIIGSDFRKLQQLYLKHLKK